MKHIPLIAALLAFSAPALAADLNKPDATFEDILRMRGVTSPLSGCFVETSVAGTFLREGSRDAQAGIGGGCDTKLGNAIVGAGIRADFMDLKSGSLFGKLGFLVNPSTSIYALASWSVPDWEIKNAGQLNLGAGSEMSIANLVPNTSLFVEGTTSVSKFGPAASRDDVSVRLGARYRF